MEIEAQQRDDFWKSTNCFREKSNFSIIVARSPAAMSSESLMETRTTGSPDVKYG